MLQAQGNELSKTSGQSRVGISGVLPNSEEKPASVDGTALETMCEDYAVANPSLFCTLSSLFIPTVLAGNQPTMDLSL